MTSKEEKTAALKLKSSRVYWMRFGLSIPAAAVCGLLRLGVEGVGVGVAVYLISYLLAKYAVQPSVSLGRNEIYLLGLSTYAFTWLALWTLLNTLLNVV